MPNRVVREGILSSERVNALSESEELFYRRLMSVVDDYGRFYAHPSIVRAACYPLKLDAKTDAQVLGYLKSCQREGLIEIYQIGSRSYLEVKDFHQRTRIMKSKFPSLEEADTIHKPDACQTSDGHHVCHNDGHMSDTCPSDDGQVTVNSQLINVNEPGNSLNKGSTENDRQLTVICQSNDRHDDGVNPDGIQSRRNPDVLSVQPSNQNSKSSNSVPDKPGQTASVLEKPETQKRSPRLADDEFLTELRATGAYDGIDLDAELRKMRAWLLTPKGRGRKLTRQFAVNWLNKVDRPLQINSSAPRKKYLL